MKILLDTHVWIWAQEDPARLGVRAKRLLVGAEHENHICTVSTLELARLVNSGAIVVSIALQEWVGRALHALQAHTVPITHEIALEAYALPQPFHKDPADRLLVAAARCHQLTMLTADERVLSYKGVVSRDARV